MAGKIPNQFIDQLIGRVDIVDVIDRRLPLTRAGREYKACCPFHEEKTPSFTVSPSKQFYHCFGCSKHGTAIGFLMDYANLSFREAIEELAEDVGLELPAQSGSATTPDERDSTNRLLETIDATSRWFQHQLRHHQDAKKAIEYLKSRGVSGEVAADFNLGFAPNGWDNLIQSLAQTPKQQQLLLKAGLVSQRDNGTLYDRFRERIIFPIDDHRGRTVGFGGRVFLTGEPKYLNSPETSLFHKGSELYGLHRARRTIAKTDQSLVVEGYMDVVGLVQHGIENVVATLGTATTRTHLQRLFRLAPDIVFCFDGDRAGHIAAWRALETVLPEMYDGRQISFLFLPEGEDPDTVIRAEGAAAFRQRFEQVLPLSDFFFGRMSKQVNLERMDGKARLVSLCQPLIDQLPVGVFSEMMHDRLSLISGIVGKRAQGLQSKLQRRHTAPKHKVTQVVGARLSGLERATWLLLQQPSLASQWDNVAALEALTLKGADLFLQLFNAARSMSDPSTAQLLESWRGSRFHGYLEELAAKPNILEQDGLPGEFHDTLQYLSDAQIEQKIIELLEKARISVLDQAEKQILLELQQERENSKNIHRKL